MKKIKFVSVLIMTLAMFSVTSCDNEPLEGEFGNGTNGGGNGGGNINSIYDKWWYDSEDFAADIYFHSNGRYEQKIVLLGVEFEGVGDWYWEDENARIMKIENLTGQGQTAAEAWFKISSIQNSSFDLQQSTNGTNYSSIVAYLDTDN